MAMHVWDTKIGDVALDLGTTAGGGLVLGSLNVGSGEKLVVATGDTVTLNQPSGRIITKSLSTAAGGTYALTVQNDQIKEGDMLIATPFFAGGASGFPVVAVIALNNGSVMLALNNADPVTDFNGTYGISFLVVKN